MRAVEIALSVLLLGLGVRSIVYWLRRSPHLGRVRHHLLFSLFVLGRAGTWFSLGGFFALSASIRVQGRAFLEEIAAIRWYALLPIFLGVLQLAAGAALGIGGGAHVGEQSPSRRGSEAPGAD